MVGNLAVRAFLRRDAEHIPQRSLGVLFKDLHVMGLSSVSSYQPTLGSMLNPLAMLSSIRLDCITHESL